MAEQPGTKALLAERGGGGETAQDSALEFARALGAGAVFLFDTRGALIARTDRPADEVGRDFSGIVWVASPLSQLTEASAFIAEVSHGPALSLVASAPVLQGAGTLLLGDEEHELRAGDVVARPPGSGVAHSLCGGADGLTYLAYGTREPGDSVYYPAAGKVRLRGLGVTLDVPPQP